MKPLFSLSMWVLFIAGVIGCVDTKHLVHGTGHQHLVTFGGIALSLAAGSYIARQEPLKSWLKNRKVMWFLFVFNLAVAIVSPFVIHGGEGIGTAAGFGVVSIGAGFGLLKGHSRPGTDVQLADQYARNPARDRVGSRGRPSQGA